MGMPTSFLSAKKIKVVAVIAEDNSDAAGSCFFSFEEKTIRSQGSFFLINWNESTGESNTMREPIIERKINQCKSHFYNIGSEAGDSLTGDYPQ